MLLAELHRKLRVRASCSACGEAGDVLSPGASEDALTSTVFGLLRYTKPELALLPLLTHIDLDAVPGSAWDLRPWPRYDVDILPVASADTKRVICEPDMVIEGPSFVVIEAKLGAPLGGDPTQLPEEITIAHRRASGRQWRVVCVTAHSRMPSTSSFRARSGTIVLDEPMPLADAIASYFDAIALLGVAGNWPTSEQVRRHLRWLSWQSVGNLVSDAFREPSLASHDRALSMDVIELLRFRALYADPFRGFSALEAAPLQWPLGGWLNGPRFSRLLALELRWPPATWLAPPPSTEEAK